MPSNDSDVDSLIRRHPELQVALDRDMINATGAARWLKDEYDLDMELESIARRVRNFEPEDGWTELTHPSEAIEGGQLEVRSNMALLVVRRARKTKDRLSSILGSLDSDQLQALRIEPTRKYYQIVVKQEFKEALERQLGEDWIDDAREEQADISFVTDDPDNAPFSALSATLETLHRQLIPVNFATSGPAGVSVLVPQSVQVDANELVRELLGLEGEE